MTDPYTWLPTGYQWLLFAVLAAATVFVGRQLARQGAPLTTDATPHGVLHIEFPWTSARAGEIVEHWRGEGLLATARRQVRFDFLYLILYPVTLSLLTSLVAGSATGTVALLGVATAWGVLLSGALDAVENIAILRMLSGSLGAPLPQVATIAATIKFTLVFGAFFYICAGGVLVAIRFLRSVS